MEDVNEQLKKFEERIKPIKQQLESVEQALSDLSSIHEGLDDIKEGKEILAPVGRGIFVKSKVLSENLTVDVGGKRYVKKSISETKNLIKNQIEKIEATRQDLNQELEKISQEMTEMMEGQQNKGN